MALSEKYLVNPPNASSSSATMEENLSRNVPLKVKSQKYSQVLPQPLLPGLDDKELQALGLITSNWGHAEYAIGCCLMNFYEMKYETARDLLHGLDFSKKNRSSK